VRDERKLGYRYSTLMMPKTPIRGLREFAFQKAGARFRISAEARPTLRAAAPTPHFLVLQNIHDLDKFPPETTDFGIFVGSPSVGTEAAGAKEHLGTASRVLS